MKILKMKKSFEAVPLDTNNNNLKDKVEKDKYEYAETIIEEETLSLLEKEIEMIKRALSRSKGRKTSCKKNLGYQKELYIEKLSNLI